MESPRFYPGKAGCWWPSVTTILSVKSKDLLVPWAAKVEREAARAVLAQMITEGEFPADPDMQIVHAERILADFDDRLKAYKSLSRKKTEATSIGKLVHARAEAEMRGDPLPDLTMFDPESGMPDDALTAQAFQAWDAYENWKAQAKLDSPETEIRIVNDAERYGGTADLIARDNYGRLAVWDYKTSKAIYEEYFAQVVAYGQGAILQGYPIETAYVIRLPKNADEGFEVQEVPDWERYWSMFLACRDLWFATYPDKCKQQAEKARKESA